MRSELICVALAAFISMAGNSELVGQSGWQFVPANAAPNSGNVASDGLSGHVIRMDDAGNVSIFDGVNWTTGQLTSQAVPAIPLHGCTYGPTVGSCFVVSGHGNQPMQAFGSYWVNYQSPGYGSACTAPYQCSYMIYKSNYCSIWDYTAPSQFTESFRDTLRCRSGWPNGVPSHLWPFYDHVRGRISFVDPGSGAVNYIDPVTKDWGAEPLLVRPGRGGAVLVYDAIGYKVVAVYSGANPSVWELDLSSMIWVEKFVVPAAFEPRSGVCAAHHAGSGTVVVFGGARLSDGQLLGDVWHYDGATFYQANIGPGPARRSGASMVYREAFDDIVMFGGSNGAALADTWTYVPGQLGVDYDFYGANCAPPSALGPTLALPWNSLPFAGQRFTVLVRDCPLFQPVFMILGLSDTAWNGGSLPLSMAPFGMPGCELLTNPVWVFPCTNIVGTAHWQVDLPGDWGGRRIYNQAVVFAPGANSAGLLMSNGGAGTVGY